MESGFHLLGALPHVVEVPFLAQDETQTVVPRFVHLAYNISAISCKPHLPISSDGMHILLSLQQADIETTERPTTCFVAPLEKAKSLRTPACKWHPCSGRTRSVLGVGLLMILTDLPDNRVL